ncbi:TonB-dependent receptor [Algivirga pacifica]|uniref:TonB-dependent receptor n=1 Tax=Algivirga pacifica TaxID=1162670 RepID=A0ABP9DBE1_9BACT
MNYKLGVALLIFWSLYFSAIGIAQQQNCIYTVEGRVLDVENRQPIPFVTVRLLGESKGAVTDAEGYFQVRHLCEKEFNLRFSCVGYKPIVHHHDGHHAMPTIYMATDVSQLETVVIESEGEELFFESATIDKIDSRSLAIRPASSLGEVLSEIEGVSFVAIGSNVQLPIIHGLYGNRILIVNNGVRHGFQNWGVEHAPEIDLNNVEKVAVLKGAAAVRFGPEAMGGVVLVEGNGMELSTPLSGMIKTGLESNGRGGYTAANIQYGGDRWSYHLGGGYTRLGDRHAPDYSLTNSGKEEVAVNAGVRFHFRDGDARLSYSLVDQKLAILRTSIFGNGEDLIRALDAEEPLIIQDFSYEIKPPYQSTAHHFLKAEADWNRPGGVWHLIWGGQWNARKEFDVRRNAERPVIDLELWTNDLQLEWEHVTWGPFEGAFGVQLFMQDNDNNPGTGTTPFIPNYNTNRGSVFVIETLERPHIRYELGVRGDYEVTSVRGRETNQDTFSNEYSLGNATLSFGVVKSFMDWEFRSNFGTAWRAPNVAELYSFGQTGYKLSYGLWRYQFNEDGQLQTNKILTEEDEALLPEKGYKWMNELKWDKGIHQLNISAYLNLIENFVYERPIGLTSTVRGPMPAFIYDRNDALFTGVDVTWKTSWSPKLEGVLGASYLWSRNIDKDEPLINQPPNYLRYDLSYKVWTTEKAQLILGADAQYTFRQYHAPQEVNPEDIVNGVVEINEDTPIFDFREAPDGYFLLGGSINGTWKNWTGQLSVYNALNKSYRNYLNEMRYFADEVGRNLVLNINYKF